MYSHDLDVWLGVKYCEEILQASHSNGKGVKIMLLYPNHSLSVMPRTKTQRPGHCLKPEVPRQRSVHQPILQAPLSPIFHVCIPATTIQPGQTNPWVMECNDFSGTDLSEFWHSIWWYEFFFFEFSYKAHGFIRTLCFIHFSKDNNFKYLSFLWEK